MVSIPAGTIEGALAIFPKMVTAFQFQQVRLKVDGGCRIAHQDFVVSEFQQGTIEETG